jgi:serine/threonine-protein kinase
VSERHLGQTLGKYRIEELIGSGGFAWVYKAFDPELEIHVALKVLKPQFAGDETFEQRFRREAATAAKLRHPNIIKIYSVGRDGDAVYFAMDYYPSGLAERLEVASVLPEEFVVRVGADVAQALGYAHREGVIHRDIKVDNILFDAHGNAVVADFGIARALSGYTGQTGTNMVVGTPQYFAPEQARAKPLDGRADIYSLGVTLYRAATGRLPFEGDDWYEIARQHVEEPPPTPRSINPDLSPAFEAAILHCLQKSPDDRPATGELLAQELAALLPATLETSAYRSRITGSEPTVVVRSDGYPAAVDNGTARKRSSAPWIAAALLVAGLTVAGSMYSRSRDAQSGPPTVKPPDSAALSTPPPVLPPVTPPVTWSRPAEGFRRASGSDGWLTRRRGARQRDDLARWPRAGRREWLEIGQPEARVIRGLRVRPIAVGVSDVDRDPVRCRASYLEGRAGQADAPGLRAALVRRVAQGREVRAHIAHNPATRCRRVAV